jgi:hypothetical protein
VGVEGPGRSSMSLLIEVLKSPSPALIKPLWCSSAIRCLHQRTVQGLRLWFRVMTGHPPTRVAAFTKQGPGDSPPLGPRSLRSHSMLDNASTHNLTGYAGPQLSENEAERSFRRSRTVIRSDLYLNSAAEGKVGWCIAEVHQGLSHHR